jgi:hypothetical protein
VESISPLQPDRLGQAALRGVLAAVGIFVLLGFYLLIRAVFRGTLQAAWRQMRAEIWRPLINSLHRRRK